MVKIKNKTNKEYNYKEKTMESAFLDKKIKKKFSEFCKKRGINKSKLIEEFYKTILLRFHDGSLNCSQGYITMNILRSPICKSK